MTKDDSNPGPLRESENAGSKPQPLCLDQFLKLSGIADTGGQAKLMIQGGEVQVNGQTETRRRRKLHPGDIISLGGERWVVSDAVARE